jgi:hypothetical protein
VSDEAIGELAGVVAHPGDEMRDAALPADPRVVAGTVGAARRDPHTPATTTPRPRNADEAAVVGGAVLPQHFRQAELRKDAAIG